GAALFLFVVLGLGVFISTISQTAGQAIQTAFLFLLPQILLSGMIFPLDAMAAGVRWIGYLLPLTYFTMISQGIMLRGAPIASLWLPFVVLTVMAVVVFTGATLRFRRDLAPGRTASPAGEELTARRAELLDRAALTPAAGRLATQLSGGMRRKLGFIMAIVHRPDLLILDEPTTGIDPVSRIDLWRLVSEAAASGAAVLMSTTYLDEAERAAHLVVLDRGRVLVQGSYDQVRAGFTGIVTQTDQP